MVVESILEMVMGILELEEEEEEEEEEEYLASLSKSLPLEFCKQQESEYKLSSKSDLLPLPIRFFFHKVKRKKYYSLILVFAL